MPGIFISYRPEHTAAIVGRLHAQLAERFGPQQVVRDVEVVDPRDDFGQRIDQVVGSSDALLAIMSSRWLLDRNPPGKRPIGIPRDWVQREVETAVRRPDVLVIPVLVEGATMPGEHELPYSIKSLANATTMPLSDLDWDEDVARLIRALEGVVDRPGGAVAALPPGAQAAPAAAPAPDDAPAGRRWFRRRDG